MSPSKLFLLSLQRHHDMAEGSTRAVEHGGAGLGSGLAIPQNALIQDTEALIATVRKDWREAQGNYDEFRFFTALRADCAAGAFDC